MAIEKTYDEWFKEIQDDPMELKNVPWHFRTYELCCEAVFEDGSALEYVPEDLKSGEMCLAAVKSSGYALKYVPERFKTLKLYYIVYQEDGMIPVIPSSMEDELRDLEEEGVDPDDIDDDFPDEPEPDSKAVSSLPPPPIAQNESIKDNKKAAEFVNAGIRYAQDGNISNAKEHFEMALSFCPENVPKLLFKIHHYLGRAYDELGNTEQAIINFQKSVELNSEKIEPMYSEAKEALSNLKSVKQAPAAKPAAKPTPQAEAPQPTAAPATGQKTCPACGKQLKATAKFCGKCGKKQDPVCTNCGVKLREGAKFCDECGTKQ